LGADQSHAWVGAWLGPQHGWVDLDPTNGIVVRDEHVMLGWGRDYSDVAPLIGVILGGGKQTLSVEVELVALDDKAP
jgi:transglutaminase-like putative cysteine protease